MSDEIRLDKQLTGEVYVSSVGSEIAVVRVNSDVLMTAKAMAKLYGVGRATVTKHLLRLFVLRKLNKKAVSSILTHRAEDGKLYRTTYYNSAAIVAVGLTLRSDEAVAFREWLGAGD